MSLHVTQCQCHNSTLHRRDLAEPGLALDFFNMLIANLRLAEEVNFPNFPLTITRDKAEKIADEVMDRWYTADSTKDHVVTALMGNASF